MSPKKETASGRDGLKWMPVDQIHIGRRHRKDLGDIEGFARRIADIGRLINPITVQPDGTLIAGERRLYAVKLLGWTEVPVHVVDIDDVVRGEFAENVDRKDFTPSELVAIGEASERAEREAARARQREAGRTKASGKLPEAGDTRDKIGKRLGISGRTYERMKEVVEAAAAEPAKYGKLLADMDRTGRANGPYKRLRNAQAAERIRAEPPPLPGRGPYRVGVGDPAWAYELHDEDPSDRGALPYPTMSIEKICKLDVASIMHEDSIIFLWVTNFVLVQGVHTIVLRAWGFEPKTLITWPKDERGNGTWLRGQTEHVVMAVRGNPVVESASLTTLLKGPFHLVQKSAHSAKPREFYDLVEKLCPAPRYCDLFSRYQHNDKWDCHGDEAPQPSADVQGDDLDIPEFLRRAPPNRGAA